MKTLKELQEIYTIRCQPLAIRVNSLMKYNVDFDVFLPSKGKNLQRPLVWSIDQKRQIVMSILLSRHIPNVSIFYTTDDVHKIIDGKQRLTSVFAFVNNEFTIILDDEEFYFKDLPDEYKTEIIFHPVRINIINQEYGVPIDDNFLIHWFDMLNFAGTPQDFEHIEDLKR